jgi:hypothetical protein
MTITRQDLEDAARAAGIEITWENGHEYPERIEYFRGCKSMPNYEPWLAHNSKADLWDLAEKCEMVIYFNLGEVWTHSNHERPCFFTPHNHTECAEAVILAAAEIWRAKK